MIKIAVIDGGEKSWLTIPSDVRLNFKRTNTAFAIDSAIPASVHVGMKIPIDGNALILKQAHRTELYNRYDVFDIEVHFRDTLHFEGALLIDKSRVTRNERYYDCDILVNGIGNRLENVSIRDLVDEEVFITDSNNSSARYFAIDAHVKAKNGTVDPAEKYCFPTFVNLDQYGGANEGNDTVDGVTFVNWHQGLGAPILWPYQHPQWNGSGVPRRWLNAAAVAPSVYCMHVLQQLADRIGYTISGDYFDDADLQREIMLGLYSLDKRFDFNALTLRKTVDFTYSTSDPDPPNILPFEETALDNAGGNHNVAGPHYIVQEAGQHRVQLSMLTNTPTAATHDIVLYLHADDSSPGVAQIAEAVIIGSGDQYNTVVFTTNSLSVGQGLSVGMNSFATPTITFKANTQLDILPETERNRNIWKGSFNLRHCVPDIAASTWLKNLKVRWGLHLVVNEVSRSLSVHFVKDVLQRSAVDLTEYLISEGHSKSRTESNTFEFKIEGTDAKIDFNRYQGTVQNLSELPDSAPITERHIYYVMSSNAFYEFDQADGTGPYQWNKIEGNAWRQYTGSGSIKSVTIPTRLLPMEEHEGLIVAEVDSPGNSDEYSMGTDGFESHYGFFFGEQYNNAIGGHSYLVTQTPISVSGAPLGSKHLSLSDAPEGFDTPFTLWKDVINLMNGAPRIEITMRHDVRVKDIPMDRPVRIHAREFVVESIDETLFQNSSFLTLTLIPI